MIDHEHDVYHHHLHPSLSIIIIIHHPQGSFYAAACPTSNSSQIPLKSHYLIIALTHDHVLIDDKRGSFFYKWFGWKGRLESIDLKDHRRLVKLTALIAYLNR